MESPIKKTVKMMLHNIIKSIDNDECSDEDLSEIIAKSSHKSLGYVHEKDYVNADEAMRILRMNNRNKFFDLMKKHNIVNKKVNNQHIGFPRIEIERLAKN